MVAREWNDNILREVEKACGNDEVTFNFLKELIFSEVDKTKYSRFMQEYLDAIKTCAVDWSGIE